MKHLFLAATTFAVISLTTACSDIKNNSNANITLESFQGYEVLPYKYNSLRIRAKIDSLIRNDSDGLTADFRTRSYYNRKSPFLWIDRHGINHRADTLLNYLHTIAQMGFSSRRFRVEEIERDLERLRNLQFDDRNNINLVMARLEYYLTKSYFRYAVGQRFGYMNPTFVFNRVDSIEPNKHDSIKRPTRYRQIFDIDMQRVNKSFFTSAIRKVQKDSLAQFLREIQPKNSFYYTLQKALVENPGMDKHLRAKILCNMERCRWRVADYPQKHQKYILVNIPSFRLLAIDKKDTLSMRIGCGSFKTKTPLLHSNVKRMDLNPKWFVPRSIIDKDLPSHLSRAYMESRNFYVVDRKSGKEVDPSRVSLALLREPGFSLVQRGGKGNSLGRIIFRFDNNFAVYMHDTSSRGVFSQEDRGVSHGCIRVEKPFDLAVFLLKEKDKKTISKIEYCMTADSLADKSKIVGSLQVEPQIPLFITYYTLYPNHSQQKFPWDNYPDVYGYDKVIYSFLNENYR